MTATDRHEQLDLLRDAVGRVDRGRGVVVVTGPEAVSFLQALVSADLDAVAPGDHVESLLLSPQGKLDVAFRLLRVTDEELWLDTDPGFGAQLADSLNKFRIRVKAEVADKSEEMSVVSLIGPRAPASVDVGDAAHVVATAHGVDVIGPRGALAAVRRFPAVDAEVFDAWRIEQGIPVQPLDVDEKTIPQEAELEVDAVSFTKGCFLGQELVCRIDSRGHVNRFLRRFESIDGDWPVRGADVVVDGKVVGALTSVAPESLPTGALGYVRREVEPPATVDLRWEGGTATATAIERKSPPSRAVS
jgi:folate-binding protein YgfZ